MEQLVFGCARLTGGASERSSVALLAAAFDEGIRAVDVAPAYGIGTAEIVVGKAIEYAAAKGITIKVYAKIGSERDPWGILKTWARATKRTLRGAPPRPLGNWKPVESRRTSGRFRFSALSLEASHSIALDRLGRIDVLMLHEAGPDDLNSEQLRILQKLASKTRATLGYAVSWPWSASNHAAYPAPLLPECAIDPAMFQSRISPPPIAGIVFHSIVPTMHYLGRVDPKFSEQLVNAAALVSADDEETRKITAFYALISNIAPKSMLIYASNDKKRLNSFLKAVKIIDRNNLVEDISSKFYKI